MKRYAELYHNGVEVWIKSHTITILKSVFAEAIANDLNIPLVTLDMSRLLSKFVGESERNIDQAITIIKQIAPCVLLIDEVEKCLGGKQLSRSCTVIY